MISTSLGGLSYESRFVSCSLSGLHQVVSDIVMSLAIDITTKSQKIILDLRKRLVK